MTGTRRPSIVQRWVAGVVGRINPTGFPAMAVVEDLAAAFGAFGVLLHFHGPVTTRLLVIRIGARAELQTNTEAEVISKPVHVGGRTK